MLYAYSVNIFKFELSIAQIWTKSESLLKSA